MRRAPAPAAAAASWAPPVLASLLLLPLLLAPTPTVAAAPAGSAQRAAQPLILDGCIDGELLQEVIVGSIGQLEATAAVRQRPDGSGPSLSGANKEDIIPADVFPNSTDPRTGKWLASEPGKWTSG